MVIVTYKRTVKKTQKIHMCKMYIVTFGDR